MLCYIIYIFTDKYEKCVGLLRVWDCHRRVSKHHSLLLIIIISIIIIVIANIIYSLMKTDVVQALALMTATANIACFNAPCGMTAFQIINYRKFVGEK